MEYVFDTKDDREILRTKNGSHTDLSGYHELVREFSDQTITDRFRIVEKYNTAEDDEGNCYDWYVIDEHYRFSDKFSSRIIDTEQEITDLMLENIEQGQSMTDMELAIMELQEKVG